MTPTTAGDIDLANPDAFIDGAPHDALTELRRTDPVHWQPMAGEPGFWAVLRHADVAHVARHPEIFSASEGGIVLEDLIPERLAMMRNMLVAMDPPVHTVHRKALSPHFRARVMAGIEDRVRKICRTIMAEAGEHRELEFVRDVASPLPTKVIGELFGLPPEDWDHIHVLAERTASSHDPELVGAEGDADAAVIELALYGIGLAAARRQNDRADDLASIILHTNFGGQPMSDIDFGSFFVQLIIAGNDTTKGMLSSGLLNLVRHPEQLAELRADPSLIPGRSKRSFAMTTRCTTSGGPRCRTPNCRAPASLPATKWRCTTRLPTATKRCSPIHRRSTSTAAPTRIYPSGSPAISAWGFTSHALKAGSSSRNCSTRSPRSISMANLSEAGPT